MDAPQFSLGAETGGGTALTKALLLLLSKKIYLEAIGSIVHKPQGLTTKIVSIWENLFVLPGNLSA